MEIPVITSNTCSGTYKQTETADGVPLGADDSWVKSISGQPKEYQDTVRGVMIYKCNKVSNGMCHKHNRPQNAKWEYVECPFAATFG